MKLTVKEKDIENAILAYLATRKDVFAWKVESHGVWDSSRKVFRRKNNPFHMRGIADILGIFNFSIVLDDRNYVPYIQKIGIPLAIEVKSKTGQPSLEQKAFLDRFESMGGLAFIARSVETVKERLDGFRFGFK